MKLSDIIENLGADDNTIVLLKTGTDGGWIGSFPAYRAPGEWLDLDVDCFSPDEFDGEGFGSGVVLKVWID